MKIVLFSGGTGSLQIQEGLNKYPELIDLTIITNFYDNGKSTGAVRTVYDGLIGGPSDIRKNQLNQARLRARYDNKAVLELIEFLEFRFTSDKPKEEVLTRLAKLSGILQKDKYNILYNSIIDYFNKPLAYSVEYSDFAIGNIVYAGLSLNNSLRAAAKTVAELLEIPDNVIVQDDTSLFLGALTKSGKHITDEGDIVEHNNAEDPIVDIYFNDAKGNLTRPVMNSESLKAISDADMIIFSSGTQWSSLIPTYISEGFKEAIELSKAKKFLVMNLTEDKDMLGKSSKDILKLLTKYIPSDVDVLIDSDSGKMSKTYKAYNCILADLQGSKSKHCPDKLRDVLLREYYKEFKDFNKLALDYDDTIKGRKGTFLSEFKSIKYRLRDLKLKSPSIISGNDIRNIDMTGCPDIEVYAENGNSLYVNNIFVKRLSENILKETEIESLTKSLISAGVPSNIIKNRNSTLLSIKPLKPDYRLLLSKYLQFVVPEHLVPRITGNTTIDIMHKNLDKLDCVKYLLNTENSSDIILYIGDEYEKGNDKNIYEYSLIEPRLKFLKVKDPRDTLLFLEVYQSLLKDK